MRELFDRSADYGALRRRRSAPREALCRGWAAARPDPLRRLQPAFERAARRSISFPGRRSCRRQRRSRRSRRELSRELLLRRRAALLEEGLRLLDPRALPEARLGDAQGAVGGPARERLAHQALHRPRREVRLDRAAERASARCHRLRLRRRAVHPRRRTASHSRCCRGSFGLDGDPALAAIGAAVHFLDVGRHPGCRTPRGWRRC